MIVKRIVFGKNSYYVLITYLYIFLIELQLCSPNFWCGLSCLFNRIKLFNWTEWHNKDDLEKNRKYETLALLGNKLIGNWTQTV